MLTKKPSCTHTKNAIVFRKNILLGYSIFPQWWTFKTWWVFWWDITLHKINVEKLGGKTMRRSWGWGGIDRHFMLEAKRSKLEKDFWCLMWWELTDETCYSHTCKREKEGEGNSFNFKSNLLEAGLDDKQAGSSATEGRILWWGLNCKHSTRHRPDRWVNRVRNLLQV